MSRKVIAFFSSDAREIYKADIFRSLALPNNYVIQFRYQSQYLHKDLFDNLDSLKNRVGVIFFASGNDTEIEKGNRKISISSIRNVVVKDVFYDRNLDLVNFYLELREFTDCKPVDGTPIDNIPPYLNVSEMLVEDGAKNGWQDRVANIQQSLPDSLYYFISSIRQGKNNELKPKYLESERKSYYQLYDESDYQIDFSFFDPSNGEFGIKAESVGDIVEFCIPPDYKVGAPRVSKTFELHTHTLPVRYRASKTTLSIKSPQATATTVPTINLSIEIGWKVYKKFRNILLFMLFSVFATVGISAATSATKDFSTTTITCTNILIGILSLFFIAVASGCFYWLFNKK